MLRSSSIALAFVFCACSGSSGPTAQLTVSASADAQSLATTPWPSDLFLDGSGHVALSMLPTAPVDLTQPTLDDLHQTQDGFAVVPGAYFPLSAAIDPATLDGKMHLYDLQTGDELPVYVHFRASDTPPTIYARPANGVVLLEHQKYAFVISSGVTGPSGALTPSSDLSSILSAHAMPSSPTLARAYTIYQPLLQLLDAGKLPRSQVVAATVFTTHSVTSTLAAARQMLGASPAPVAKVSMIFADQKTANDTGSIDELLGSPTSMVPGYDNPGGIWHGDMGYVVQGSFTSQDFLNNVTTLTPAGGTPTSIDTFTADGSNMPSPKGTVTIPFTLVLPKSPPNGSYANLPTVIFQHGLGGSRDNALSLANSLCAQGFAVVAIDIPFHGSRDATAVDKLHNFTKAPGPDGFAEVSDAPFVAFFDATGNQQKSIPPFDFVSVRDAFMEAALDTMQEARLVTVGDLSAIGQMDPRLSSLSLRHDKLAYSSESFGSMYGTLTNAIEPSIGAAFLDVGGGGLLFPLLLNSAVYGPKIAPFLDGALGTVTGVTDDPTDTDFAYNLANGLLEQGDAAAYAPYVLLHPLAGNAPKQVIQPSAHLDESVPNQANVDLAQALGLLPVNLPDGGNIDLQFWTNAPAPMTAPLAGNVMVNGQAVTAAFIQFEQASHGMLTGTHGERDWDVTQPYPFPSLSPPQTFTNPTARLQKILVGFVQGYFSGMVPTVGTGE